jgi:hypothetical protein
MTKAQHAARAQRAIRARKLKLVLGSAAAVRGDRLDLLDFTIKPFAHPRRCSQGERAAKWRAPIFRDGGGSSTLPMTLSPELFPNALGFEAYRIAKNFPGVLAHRSSRLVRRTDLS